jgi:hypothetical protein
VHRELTDDDVCFILTIATPEPKNLRLVDGTSIKLCFIPVYRFSASMPPGRILADRDTEERLQCPLAFPHVFQPLRQLRREECRRVATGRKASLASCLAKWGSTSCCAMLRRAECSY